MKTGFKWTLGILGGLFALVIILILVLPVLIDPNDYKDKLIGFVEKKTGRQVELKGDIDLSLSMGLDVVFNLGRVSVSGSSPFANTTFAESDRVELKLKLLPLIIRKELNISKMYLKGVHLNLIKDKNGAVNWQATTQARPSDTAKKKEKKRSEKGKTAKLPRVDLGGIQAEDISVTFDNRQAGQIIQLSDLNIKSGHILDGKEFPFKLSFHVESNDSAGNTHAANIAMNSNFILDSKSQQCFIKAFRLDGSVKSDKISETAQTITVALEGDIDLNNEKANLNKLALNFNNSVLTGRVTINDLRNPSYDAQLHLNSIDLDRYKKKKKDTAKGKKEAREPFQLPVKLLKALTFQANLSIDQLKLSGINLSDITIKAEGENKLLRLSELSAKLYGGTVRLQGELDMTAKMPKLTASESLDHVQVESLLKDMKDTDDISGIAKVDAHISSFGKTDKEMIRNMSGDLSIELRNGMIKSLKIIKIIRIAKALYLKEAIGGESADEPSGFARLTATGKIKNGVFHNNNLKAHSDLMKVTGIGKADLANKTVDYQLNIYLASRLERDLASGNVIYDEAPILYTVKGPFSDLEQDADVTKVLASEGKKLLIKEVQKQLEGGPGGGSLLERGLKIFGR